MYMKKWIMICVCVAVFQTALAQRITRQYNNVSFSAALKIGRASCRERV